MRHSARRGTATSNPNPYPHPNPHPNLNPDPNPNPDPDPTPTKAWDSDMFRFFCHMFYRDMPFEDMYCFSLRMLDRIFVELDADYADFNTVRATG